MPFATIVQFSFLLVFFGLVVYMRVDVILVEGWNVEALPFEDSFSTVELEENPVR